MGYTQGRKLIISCTEHALDLYPANILDHKGFLSKTGDSYDIGWETAQTIISHYPEIKGRIEPEHVAMASGMKDLGKVLFGKKFLKPLRTAQYIEEHGVGLGISDKQDDVDRVAQMVRPHPQTRAEWDTVDRSDRKEFLDWGGGFDTTILIHRTLPEYIVTYSGIRSYNGTGSLEGAFEEYAKFSPLYGPIMKNGGRERFSEIFGTVNIFLKGEREISNPDGFFLSSRNGKNSILTIKP